MSDHGLANGVTIEPDTKTVPSASFPNSSTPRICSYETPATLSPRSRPTAVTATPASDARDDVQGAAREEVPRVEGVDAQRGRDGAVVEPVVRAQDGPERGEPTHVVALGKRLARVDGDDPDLLGDRVDAIGE